MSALHTLEIRHARLMIRREEEVTDVRIAVDEADRGRVVQGAETRQGRPHDLRAVEHARDGAAMWSAHCARDISRSGFSSGSGSARLRPRCLQRGSRSH